MGDYTLQLASALAEAGDEVHVWTPPEPGEAPSPAGVRVHQLADHFGPRGLASLESGLDSLPAPRRLLVQYVAGAFGRRGMNLPFCRWLSRRRQDHVWIMFHEWAFPLGWRQKPRHNLLGVVTRLMGRTVARRADRVFVSTPAWLARMPRSARAVREAVWLPIPSNLPVQVDPARVRAARAGAAVPPGSVVIGHFGSYAPHVAALLQEVLPPLLAGGAPRVGLLMGRGSRRFRDALVGGGAVEGSRLVATGGMPAGDVAAHMRACDVLVQPYRDGATTRRGSLMAGLALGLPIVTNTGPSTEPLWREEGAVALARDPTPASIVAAAEGLLSRPESWAALGLRAAGLYRSRFSLGATVATLRELAARDDGRA